MAGHLLAEIRFSNGATTGEDQHGPNLMPTHWSYSPDRGSKHQKRIQNMAVSPETPMHGDLLGIVAFTILARLMLLLEQKGVLTNAERAKLFDDAGRAFSPSSDPRVRDVKQLLRTLVATIQAQQIPPPRP